MLAAPNVQSALDKLVRKGLPSIRLIHSCDHFSNAYGLNRFLALLVGLFVESPKRQGAPVFLDRRRVAAITHDPGCSSGAADPWAHCLGKTHDIDLERADDCRHDPRPPATAGRITANVLIIRHGINTAAIPALPTIRVRGKSVPPLPDVALTRQVAPYHALK
jgi:hypothetical protein